MDKRIILDTATPEEIMKIIISDKDFLFNKIIEDCKRYIHIVKSRADKRRVFFTTHKGNRGLTYSLIYISKSKRDSIKNNLIWIAYTYYQTRNGYNTVLLSSIDRGKESFVFYNSHFFDRYRERELKDETLSKPETIKEFFKENSISIHHPLENSSNPNGIFCVFKNNGVGLGEELSGNCIILKTYISTEMLKEGQVELHEKTLSRIKQLIVLNNKD